MKRTFVSIGFDNECQSLAVIPGVPFASSPAYCGFLCHVTLHGMDGIRIWMIRPTGVVTALFVSDDE